MTKPIIGLDFDELFIKDPTNIHIERMNDDHIWMRIERSDGPALAIQVWSRGKVGVLIEEDE